MAKRVVCPSCGHQNSIHRITCKGCRTRLSVESSSTSTQPATMEVSSSLYSSDEDSLSKQMTQIKLEEEVNMWQKWEYWTELRKRHYETSFSGVTVQRGM